jgi:prepilin-type N-terminal cleavage/methylation domain-containing protein
MIKSNQRSEKGFNLIELLAVMAIIALMMGIAVPSIMHTTRSNAVLTGASDIANAVTFARAQAVALNGSTMLIFADNPGPNDYSLAPPKTSYAVMVCTNMFDETNGQTWRYVSDWNILPKGAFLSGTLPTVPLAQVPFPTNGQNYVGGDIKGLVFNQLGSLDDNSDITLTVQQGVIIPNSSPVKYASTNESNKLEIQINGITGKPKVIR